MLVVLVNTTAEFIFKFVFFTVSFKFAEVKYFMG